MPGPDDPTRPSFGDITSASSFPSEPGDAAALQHGQRVGRFIAIRLLGAGGMGAVYEALQDQPARPVALKIMRSSVATPAALQRFRDEAQLLATLSHPAIAQVYEAGVFVPPDSSDATPFYAMELVRSGVSIRAYSARHRLNQDQVLRLMATVCRAVGHGHAQGVIHRDLKPSNILVDQDGHPKVIDFGIARSLDTGRALTLEGHVVGTLAYMSPEQASGASVDERSDVYALGLILYELLCGRPPYELDGMDFPTAVSTICSRPPRQPSGIDPPFADGAGAILAQALQKEPRFRYRDGRAMAEDIERLLAGDVPAASRRRFVTALRARGTSALRRAPRVWAVVLGACAVLVARLMVEPLVFSHTSLNARYEHWLSSVSGAPPALSRVSVIALEEDDGQLAALARAHDIEPFDATVIGGLRALEGAVMKRLAPARPRVVVWDSTFRRIEPGQSTVDTDLANTAFLAGVHALREASIDTVIAPDSWAFDRTGLPEIDPQILPHVRWGCGSASAEPWANLTVAIAAQTGVTEPRAGLPLQAMVSAKHPGASAHLTFDSGTDRIGLEYYVTDPARPDGRRPLGTVEWVTVSQVRPAGDAGSDVGLLPDDVVAEFTLRLPSPDALNEDTWSLTKVLGASDEALAAQFGDRVVVIGDRRGNNDSQARADQTVVWSPHLMALAIDRLLDAEPVRLSTERENWATTTLAAAVGGFVAWRLRTARRALGAVLALLALAVVASVVAYRYAGLLANPAAPGAALALSAFAAARISSRYRHR